MDINSDWRIKQTNCGQLMGFAPRPLPHQKFLELTQVVQCARPLAYVIGTNKVRILGKLFIQPRGEVEFSPVCHTGGRGSESRRGCHRGQHGYNIDVPVEIRPRYLVCFSLGKQNIAEETTDIQPMRLLVFNPTPSFTCRSLLLG